MDAAPSTECVDTLSSTASLMPLVARSEEPPNALGGPARQPRKLVRSSPSLARRGPLLVLGPDRLNPRICSPSSSSARVVSRTTQTTNSAPPLLLSSTADSAFRGDTPLHQAQFASPWSTSAEWTLAPCPYLKARLWHSPLCSKSSSTDLRKRVEAHQARGERVQGSKHSPQSRFPASFTVSDADAIGPKVTDSVNSSASSISLFSNVSANSHYVV